MSTTIWRAPGSNVSLVFNGRLRFEDIATPVPSKNEWGVDILERTLRGPVYLLDAFCRSLRQGQQYAGFHLQSWQPSIHPYAPTVTLLYKGLIGGIPDPLISNARVEVCGSIQANGISVTVGSRVFVSATKEVKYITPHTTYRYISTSEPLAARYRKARGAPITVTDSRITATDSEGSTAVFTGGAPAGIATALFGNPFDFVIGPMSSRIFGTPYWECEDQVELRFAGE